MGLYMKCPFLQQHWSLGWGGSFFSFLDTLFLGYWRLLPCCVIPTAAEWGCFVCQALQGSLEQNNPELVLCHTCMEFPAEGKLQPSHGYSKALAKPWGADKALEVLQESGNLRMESIKEGGKGFGRFTGRGIKNIYTVQTNPRSNERMKL